MQTEHKYRLIAEAQRKGHTVTFDVLYYAKSKRIADILEEIGAAEGDYIRQYHPLLNTQIPRETNWHKYDYNSAAAKLTADEFMQAITK